MRFRRSQLLRRVGAVAVALVIAVGLGLLARERITGRPEDLLRRAEFAMLQGDYARAGELARRVLRIGPASPQACFIAGEAATRLGHLEEAVEYYARIPDRGDDHAVLALYCTGDVLYQLGRAAEAEESYRRALRHQPDHVWCHEQLAAQLTLFGRRWEAVPHLFALVRENAHSIDHLLLLGSMQNPVEMVGEFDRFRRDAPDDPLTLVALARQSLSDDDSRGAERLCRRALASAPQQIEAWAILGHALQERPERAFAAWSSDVPSAAEAHPGVWTARGFRARRDGALESAARCFWEAVRRDPDSRIANYQLGQVLVSLGRSDRAEPFLKRAELLQQLDDVLNSVYRDRTAVEHLRRAAELTEALGRLWEAAAWSQAALAVGRNLPWASERLRTIVPQLGPDLPRTRSEDNSAAALDLSEYALPNWSGSQSGDSIPVPDAAAAVRFIDRAFEAGVRFQYDTGADEHVRGGRMFEATGGGVAALDFDGDGWPDLYFTQGGDPFKAGRASSVTGRPGVFENGGTGAPPGGDRMFRNRGDGGFEDVTDQSGLGDTGYGQGVAVGDFDGDGFPDLYVANLQGNRLYRNNGDGTFADVTGQAGLTSHRWTTSCLIADLNGDGLPDLYDVNYLTGRDVHTRICFRDGRPRTCDPGIFAAEQDQLFLNLGDGRFEEVSASAGIIAPDGKGLGIVAADFDGSGRLSLFVANDTTANFYFVNETASPGELPQFRERALFSGLAFDEDGRSQACMGIAVDDARGDGLLDLFVTNYYRQANTYYHQTAPMLFHDGTRDAGLREPGFLLLGFGTQFLDADLDGWPDLVVTNGHVTDYTDTGIPLQMPPQFFRNQGGGRFVELEANGLGPYFQGAWLGRGLARVDWNRDGREDFVVTHLDAPAALLTNETVPAGRFLALVFRGTRGGRDGIGVTARLTAGGRTRMRQLTAGDGYHASNQRQLVFGLGEAERVERLHVRWPSGVEQTFEDIDVDQELLLIEGRDRPFALPSP